MLEALGERVRTCGQDRLRILEVLKPTAKLVLEDNRCSNIDKEKILRKLRAIMPYTKQ
jgi:hypothetical protein